MTGPAWLDFLQKSIAGYIGRVERVFVPGPMGGRKSEPTAAIVGARVLGGCHRGKSENDRDEHSRFRSIPDRSVSIVVPADTFDESVRRSKEEGISIMMQRAETINPYAVGLLAGDYGFLPYMRRVWTVGYPIPIGVELDELRKRSRHSRGKKRRRERTRRGLR